MSRIGKEPVTIPSGVTIEKLDRLIKVKGPNGELEMTFRPEVEVEIADGVLTVSTTTPGRQAQAYWGLTRSLINNMVVGVTTGYAKVLDIIGIGWNATVQGQQIALNVGFANTIMVDILPGTEIRCPNPTAIEVKGIDKQAVGQLAARIRAARPPEPYKGKGIRYRNEYVKMKAGKSFGS